MAHISSDNIGPVSRVEQYRLRMTTESRNYQSLVNAKCKVWDLGDDCSSSGVPEMAFPSSDLMCFTERSGNTKCSRLREHYSRLTVPRGIRKRSSTMAYVLDTAEGLNGGSSNDSDSSFLVFAVRLLYSLNATNFGVCVVACSYMAHRIPSPLSIDSNSTGSVESNVTDLSIFANETSLRERRSDVVMGSMIGFKQSWLPYLDLRKNDNSTTSVGNATVAEVDITTIDDHSLLDTFFSAMSLSGGSGDFLFGPAV